MKTLIGIVSYGNLAFTQLTVREIKSSTKSPIEFYVVVGKPGDIETERWLATEGIPHLVHSENWGFPASLNDIMDYAWGGPMWDREPIKPGLRVMEGRRGALYSGHDYDAVIIAGNDIVPYPGAMDALIECAEHSHYEWIAASQYDVQSLCRMYPEARDAFKGAEFVFPDFTKRPWELHGTEVARVVQSWKERQPDEEASFVETNGEGPSLIKDVHNLCLYRRSVFDKLGYIDVNFWPAYFSDNDIARRAVNEGIKSCALRHAVYFHFWSRTIKQGDGHPPRAFAANAEFYGRKWGGAFAHEAWRQPFNGVPPVLTPPIVLPASLKIASRADEAAIVRYWQGR